MLLLALWLLVNFTPVNSNHPLVTASVSSQAEFRNALLNERVGIIRLQQDTSWTLPIWNEGVSLERNLTITSANPDRPIRWRTLGLSQPAILCRTHGCQLSIAFIIFVDESDSSQVYPSSIQASAPGQVIFQNCTFITQRPGPPFEPSWPAYQSDAKPVVRCLSDSAIDIVNWPPLTSAGDLQQPPAVSLLSVTWHVQQQYVHQHRAAHCMRLKQVCEQHAGMPLPRGPECSVLHATVQRVLASVLSPPPTPQQTPANQVQQQQVQSPVFPITTDSPSSSGPSEISRVPWWLWLVVAMVGVLLLVISLVAITIVLRMLRAKPTKGQKKKVAPPLHAAIPSKDEADEVARLAAMLGTPQVMAPGVTGKWDDIQIKHYLESCEKHAAGIQSEMWVRADTRRSDAWSDKDQRSDSSHSPTQQFSRCPTPQREEAPRHTLPYDLSSISWDSVATRSRNYLSPTASMQRAQPQLTPTSSARRSEYPSSASAQRGHPGVSSATPRAQLGHSSSLPRPQLTPTSSLHRSNPSLSASFQKLEHQAELSTSKTFHKSHFFKSSSLPRTQLEASAALQRAQLKHASSLQRTQLSPSSSFQTSQLTPSSSFNNPLLTPSSSLRRAQLTPSSSFNQPQPAQHSQKPQLSHQLSSSFNKHQLVHSSSLPRDQLNRSSSHPRAELSHTSSARRGELSSIPPLVIPELSPSDSARRSEFSALNPLLKPELSPSSSARRSELSSNSPSSGALLSPSSSARWVDLTVSSPSQEAELSSASPFRHPTTASTALHEMSPGRSAQRAELRSTGPTQRDELNPGALSSHAQWGGQTQGGAQPSASALPASASQQLDSSHNSEQRPLTSTSSIGPSEVTFAKNIMHEMSFAEHIAHPRLPASASLRRSSSGSSSSSDDSEEDGFNLPMPPHHPQLQGSALRSSGLGGGNEWVPMMQAPAFATPRQRPAWEQDEHAAGAHITSRSLAQPSGGSFELHNSSMEFHNSSRDLHKSSRQLHDSFKELRAETAHLRAQPSAAASGIPPGVDLQQIRAHLAAAAAAGVAVRPAGLDVRQPRDAGNWLLSTAGRPPGTEMHHRSPQPDVNAGVRAAVAAVMPASQPLPQPNNNYHLPAAAVAGASDRDASVRQPQPNLGSALDPTGNDMLGVDVRLAQALAKNSRQLPEAEAVRQVQTDHHFNTNPLGVEFRQVLGHGGFGTVYQGSWNGMTVAVKVVPCLITEGDESTARTGALEGEAVLAADLDHPNVLRTLTYSHAYAEARMRDAAAHNHQGLTGKPPRETHIVMEFADLGTVDTWLAAHCGQGWRTRRAPVMRILREVASALVYLHQSSIVHGDLKASNVLLKRSETGEHGFISKVADFGLSCVLTRGKSHTSLAKVEGTLAYMPPEMLTDGRLSPAADVYAFGLLMYELATGLLAFSGMINVQIVYVKMFEDIEDKLHFPPELPVKYMELARRCWSKSVSSRPSMVQVSSELDAMARSTA